MFRQSIDPKGAFPPKSSKKPVKKPKKKPIKRRKRTRDRFGAERKQEQVFRFGERRSGLSGRQIFRPPQEQSNFSPGDYLRIHQEAIQNQLREQAEKKATGGTFTGTSIGEERKVKEQQQADREFRRQEAETRRRFVGALERFVDKATQPKPEPKPDKEVLGALKDIKEEIKTAKVPVIKLGDKPKPEESVGIADIEEISTPIAEHRKPEEDISFLSLDRSSRSNTTPASSDRPRPTPSNPSLSTSIPSQEKIDENTFLANLERQSRQPEVELSQQEQEEIRYKIYDSLVGGLTQPKTQELGYREPRPEPELTIEEITPEARQRRSQFLEEQEDITEFLTPTGDIPIAETISVDKPTETPPIPLPLTAGTEQISPDELVRRAKKIRQEAEKDLEEIEEEEKPKTPPKRTPTERQEGETEQDFLDRLSKVPDPASLRPAEEIKLEAKLEQYKELAKFGQRGKPGDEAKSFDDEKEHYRLIILEDIETDEDRAKYLGASKTNKQRFRKGDQYRLKNVYYTRGSEGYNFYRNNDGKQGRGQSTFKINLNKKGQNIERAIKEGKIKIIFDEFDDEI